MAIKVAEANRAISAACEKAAELNESISVTVCDSSGHLVAHQRMDGVFAWASHFSIGKAIAAAECGIPSGDRMPHGWFLRPREWRPELEHLTFTGAVGSRSSA
jgi:uncharacterized protein GlcG (DUF336 family)